MIDRITVAGLQVAAVLHDFLVHEAMPGTGISPPTFWNGLSRLITELAPRNRTLLANRDWYQLRIDEWHRTDQGQPFDERRYQDYLRSIGYIILETADFTIATANVDDEIASIAGPQLVVPLSNARYSLNAANARWGSLYDALYGTDAIPEDGCATRGTTYNPVRGARVIERARLLLDLAAPLRKGSHRESTSYTIVDGA